MAKEEYFSERGKVNFPDFFPAKLSILVDPKQISVVSKSDEQKKNVYSFSSFSYLFSFHFQFSTSSLSNFPSFLPPFPFLPCPPFSWYQYVSKNFPVKNVRGPLTPPACYVTEHTSGKNVQEYMILETVVISMWIQHHFWKPLLWNCMKYCTKFWRKITGWVRIA